MSVLIPLGRKTFKLTREVEPNTCRPYRIWDSVGKRDVRYRYYSTELAALNSALLLVKWIKISNTLEIYDIRTGRWIATYERKVNTIAFSR